MLGARIVMHVDFDYFFAQVEEREEPKIKDKPVVVCVYSGRGEDSGAVSTANYVAREYGVRSGISIRLAKKRLQDVESIFLPVNHSLYDAVSQRIMNIIHGYADRFEQIGVDEAFLEVTERVSGSFEKARKLAVKIKKKIFAEEKITCSIGIGPNKLIAKIAAGRQKPDGLMMIRPEEVEEFLFRLPVRELVGVGRKTEKALHKLGIRIIGELATSNIDRLTDIFGKTLGIYLHTAALGIDESPVEQRGRAESVSRIVTLKEDTRNLTEIVKQIDELAEDIYSNVMKQGLSFKSVSIVAVMNDFTTLSRSKTFHTPVKNLETVKTTATELLEQLLKDETERFIRRVGVKISGFIDEKGQKELSDFFAT